MSFLKLYYHYVAFFVCRFTVLKHLGGGGEVLFCLGVSVVVVLVVFLCECFVRVVLFCFVFNFFFLCYAGLV